MAPKILQSAQNVSNGSSTTVTCAYGSNVTAGSLLVCAVAWNSGANDPDFTSVTDSLGNTWTCTEANMNWEPNLQTHYGLFYVANTLGGANTVTGTPAAARISKSMIIAEFRGIAVTSALHKNARTASAHPGGTGTDQEVGASITPTVNGCLIVGMLGNAQALTVAGGTGYTVEQNINNNTSLNLEWLIQTTAGAITPTWTVSGTSQWVSESSAAFLPTKAPPPTPGRAATYV